MVLSLLSKRSLIHVFKDSLLATLLILDLTILLGDMRGRGRQHRRAAELIMDARKHWFAEEEKA